MDRRSALGAIAGLLVAPLGVPAGTPLSEKKEVMPVAGWSQGIGPSDYDRISPMIWIMHRDDGFYSWERTADGDGRWLKIHLSGEAQKSLFWQ